MLLTQSAAITVSLERINGWIWSPTLLALILFVGVLLSVRTRFVQVRHLSGAMRLLRHADGGDGISPFSVLCTALSAAIGTGNIVGVATAVATGGPGALFWMLLSAFFGMALKFAEGVLAVKYRITDGGELVGGPFYYIERGMGRHFRWLGKVYAFFGAFAGLCGIGTITQSNSIAIAAQNLTNDTSAAISVGGVSYSWTMVIVGGVVTVLAAAVILGGISRISRVATVLVPLVLCVYVGAIGMILLTNITRIPRAVSLVLHAAFAPKAALGAVAGITVKQAMRLGIGRGIFSNEAGLGTEAIAAASARTTSPVRQGLLCMLSTFIDTIVLCTAAGLTLIVTDAYRQSGLHGVEMTAYAWMRGLALPASVSRALLMLCLIFFAFSTVLGWNFYAERCMRYLCGGRVGWMRAYRLAYIGAVFIGPYLSVSAAWTVADISNGCMLFPNLAALLSLSGVVARETREYFTSNTQNLAKKGKKLLDGRRKH